MIGLLVIKTRPLNVTQHIFFLVCLCCGKTVVYEKVGLPTSILETNSPRNLDFCIFILNYITKPFGGGWPINRDWHVPINAIYCAKFDVTPLFVAITPPYSSMSLYLFKLLVSFKSFMIILCGIET